jgi:hypothetical protein
LQLSMFVNCCSIWGTPKKDCLKNLLYIISPGEQLNFWWTLNIPASGHKAMKYCGAYLPNN